VRPGWFVRLETARFDLARALRLVADLGEVDGAARAQLARVRIQLVERAACSADVHAGRVAATGWASLVYELRRAKDQVPSCLVADLELVEDRCAGLVDQLLENCHEV